ncbi:hypothetical protein [uncultured Endozoicomonas sp.]|uniref:hypothetical protein n=1 Tax=uncultured Endozoicomonas sp. TaxID=432652 RepID=UPI00261BFF21|nr:hypothetical protein [uncultured Endozoicomonas sp.]
MSISIQRIIGKNKKEVFLPVLLMMIYLLVVNYALSHVHSSPQTGAENTYYDEHHDSGSSFIDQEQDEALSANWQSDKQHTHGCSLVAQVAASLPCQKPQALYVTVYDDALSLLSFTTSTPIKKKIRAPPFTRT